jgi:uncharacterized transporter YbjL
LAKPELSELLRWAFFYLFLFSVGYSVGPQFFGSLNKEAFQQIALARICFPLAPAAFADAVAFLGFISCNSVFGA